MKLTAAIALSAVSIGSVNAGFKYTRWMGGGCNGKTYSIDIFNDATIPDPTKDGVCTSYGNAASEKLETVNTKVTVAPKLSEGATTIYYYTDDKCETEPSKLSTTISNADGAYGGTSVFTCSAASATEKKPSGESSTINGNCAKNGDYYAKIECSDATSMAVGTVFSSVTVASLLVWLL